MGSPEGIGTPLPNGTSVPRWVVADTDQPDFDASRTRSKAFAEPSGVGQTLLGLHALALHQAISRIFVIARASSHAWLDESVLALSSFWTQVVKLRTSPT